LPIEDTDIITAARESLTHVRCWRIEDSHWWCRVKPTRSALTDCGNSGPHATPYGVFWPIGKRTVHHRASPLCSWVSALCSPSRRSLSRQDEHDREVRSSGARLPPRGNRSDCACRGTSFWNQMLIR